MQYLCPMEYRKLGQSGLQVSALSLGSWLTFGGHIEDAMADKLMSIAYDAGINFFDNAESYQGGKSEVVMGTILKQKTWSRSSYIVSSKIFWGSEEGKPNQKGLSRKHIYEATHKSLKSLQLEYIDLMFCHRPDKTVPIEETVWAMHNLIQQGKFLYWGTSEWSASEIMEAHLICEQHHLIKPMMEQPQYNMFVRNKMENDFLHLFKHKGMGTTIWSPLASGLLSGKYVAGTTFKDTRLGDETLAWLKDSTINEDRMAKITKLKFLTNELNLSLPVLALSWCLKNPNVSTVILGATKTAQLEENLSALDKYSLLTPEVMDKIDLILQNKPVLPVY
jgi:voltage-dependent potassium channel beta subunit